MEFRPLYEAQSKALFSKKRILLFASGTQAGKTTVGAVRMKLRFHYWEDKDPRNSNFLITSPTYKILSQSTLPAFFKYMHGCGNYNKKEDMFESPKGAKIYMRTEKDPDSIIGITNVRGIWADEAGKYRLYFWENLQARADFLGCQIDLTTSPYSLNWVFKELIKPYRNNERHDVEYIAAASWDNPLHSLHDPVKRAEVKSTMDERRFNMVYGGQWDRMEGLVYDCWDDDQNLIPGCPLVAGTRIVAGVDWGYHPDPFAMTIRAITPSGDHIGISEYGGTRHTISDIITVAKQKKDLFGITMFYCDPSQPGYIEEFNRNGLPAQAADNDIRRGIDLHYELIKQRKYKEFKHVCPYSADERETYHYPEEKDLGPDEASKEQLPVDSDNHWMDSQRYVTIMTYRANSEKKTPYVPEEGLRRENHRDRLKRLYKKTRPNAFETWS